MKNKFDILGKILFGICIVAAICISAIIAWFAIELFFICLIFM